MNDTAAFILEAVAVIFAWSFVFWYARATR
jgi:hypothetical protein